MLIYDDQVVRSSETRLGKCYTNTWNVVLTDHADLPFVKVVANYIHYRAVGATVSIGTSLCSVNVGVAGTKCWFS